MDTSLGSIVDEDILDHALVYKKNEGVLDVQVFGVVNFAACAAKGLIFGGIPEADVVDAYTLAEEVVGESELPEGLDGLGLQPIRSPGRCLVGSVIYYDTFYTIACEIRSGQ